MLLIFKILQIPKKKIDNPGKYTQKYEQAVQEEGIQLAKMHRELPTLSCTMDIQTNTEIPERRKMLR